MKRFLLVVLVVGCLVSNGNAGQAQSAADPAGITVVGTGVRSAAADLATLELVISDLSAMYSGMPMMPEVESTPGAQAAASVAPVVDAVSAIDGVEDLTVTIPPATNPYGGPVTLARITLMVTGPSADQLLTIVTTASQAAAGENLTVTNVGALFTVSDCASLDRAARQAALDDARAKAEVQADLIDVSLGDIVSVVDDTYGFGAGTPSSGCDPVVPGMTYYSDPFSGATLPPFDPTRDATEVSVFRMTRVTFAVADVVATPAA